MLGMKPRELGIASTYSTWIFGATMGLVLLASGASAASFDCSKAASRVEHMICDDVSLSMLDGQLEVAYAGALDRSIHPDQVVADQRAWLRKREDCTDLKCLVAAYSHQIVHLTELSDEPAICAAPTTPAINACAAEYSRRADKELDRYLAAARKRITTDTTEETVGASTKEILAAFDAAQAAWVAYRKADCDAVYDYWSGGTIRGAMYEGCWRSVTKSRTTEIWSDWLTFMDSTPALMPKPTEK